MPFPKTWLEEMVIEWLHLEGFLVEANLPVSTPERGGRREADVVGGKISDDTLVIKHVETGTLAGGKGSITSIEKKFSLTVAQPVTEYFKQRLSFTSDRVDYQKMYVASYWTAPTVEGLKRLGVLVVTLPDFICGWVLPTISRWKGKPPHRPRTSGKHITLPETYWLLQLVDYLNTRDLLTCPPRCDIGSPNVRSVESCDCA